MKGWVQVTEMTLRAVALPLLSLLFSSLPPDHPHAAAPYEKYEYPISHCSARPKLRAARSSSFCFPRTATAEFLEDLVFLVGCHDAVFRARRPT